MSSKVSFAALRHEADDDDGGEDDLLARRVDEGGIFPVVEGWARKAEADEMAERSAVATTRAAAASLRGVMVGLGQNRERGSRAAARGGMTRGRERVL